MQIHNAKHRNRKKVIVLISAVLIVCALLVGTSYALKTWPFERQTPVTPTTPVDPASLVNSLKPATEASKTQASSDPTPTPQPIKGSTLKSVNLEITSISPITKDSTTLDIRTLLQTVTNTGTCTITATSTEHNTYSQSTGVQSLPSSSTCKGFNIPLADLGKGTWTIRIDFSNDSLTASTSKSITIQ